MGKRMAVLLLTCLLFPFPASTQSLWHRPGALFNTLDGIRVIDGVRFTRDITGIQAAIHEANATGGGMVFVPCGTYWIAGSLSLPNGVSLMGASESCVTFNNSLAGCQVVRTAIPVPQFVSAEIAGINFKGPPGAPAGTCAIELRDANLTYVRDITISRSESGILLNAATLYVESNIFERIEFTSGVRFLFHSTNPINTGATFDHNIIRDIRATLDTVGADFLFIGGWWPARIQNLRVEGVNLFPDDTSDVAVHLANASHIIEKATFDIKRARDRGFTTCRSFILDDPENIVTYDGKIECGGIDSVISGAIVSNQD